MSAAPETELSASDGVMTLVALALVPVHFVAKCWALSVVWRWHVEPVILLPLTPWTAAGLLALMALARPPAARHPTPPVSWILNQATLQFVWIGMALAVAWVAK